jgi:hypothetical protein
MRQRSAVFCGELPAQNRHPVSQLRRASLSWVHGQPCSVLEGKRAFDPSRAVARATLREEARRCVGDTGLLDHLLRHMPRAGEQAQVNTSRTGTPPVGTA